MDADDSCSALDDSVEDRGEWGIGTVDDVFFRMPTVLGLRKQGEVGRFRKDVTGIGILRLV